MTRRNILDTRQSRRPATTRRALLRLAALLLMLLAAGQEAKGQAVSVKMTYVNLGEPDTSYGEIGYGEAAMAGYNKISNGSVDFGNTSWGCNWITYIQIDASVIRGSITSATLKVDVSGSTDGKRATTWGVGYSSSTWSSTMTYNTADRRITTCGTTESTTTTSASVYETKAFDIIDAFNNDDDNIVTLVVYETAAAGGNIKNPRVTITVEDVVYIEDIAYPVANGSYTVGTEGYFRLDGTNGYIYPIKTTGEEAVNVTEGSVVSLTGAGSNDNMVNYNLRIKTRNEIDVKSLLVNKTLSVGTTVGKITDGYSITVDGVKVTINGRTDHTPIIRSMGSGYGITVIDGNGYTFGNQDGSNIWGTVYKLENTTGSNKTIQISGYFNSTTAAAATLHGSDFTNTGQSLSNPGDGSLAKGSFTLAANTTYYLWSQLGDFCLNQLSGPRFEHSYAVTTIGSTYTQAVSYMSSPTYSIVNKVGDISGESVTVSNIGEVSGLTKGGAVMVQATDGTETVSYVLTVAYPASSNKEWTFNLASDDYLVSASTMQGVVPSPLTQVTDDNGNTWTARYKNVTTSNSPEWRLDRTVAGDNAFIVPATAGLVFNTGASGFYLYDYKKADDRKSYKHIGICGSAASLTIPMLSKGDIVVLNWRHFTEDSGSKFTATNVQDLRGKKIDESFMITKSQDNNQRGWYSFEVVADGDVTFALQDAGYTDILSVRIYKGPYVPTMSEIRQFDEKSTWKVAETALVVDNESTSIKYAICQSMNSTGTGPAYCVLKGYRKGIDPEECISGYDSNKENPTLYTDEDAYPVTEEERTRLYELRKNLVGFRMYNIAEAPSNNSYNYGHIAATSGWGKVTIRMNNYTNDMKYVIGYTPDYTLTIGSAPHQEYPYTWDFTRISEGLAKGFSDNVYNSIRQTGGESDAYYDEYGTNWSNATNGIYTLNTDNGGQFGSQYVPGAVLVTTNRALSKYKVPDDEKALYAQDELDGLGFEGKITIHADNEYSTAGTRSAANERLLSYKMNDPNYAEKTDLAAGNGYIYFGAEKREASDFAACGYGYKCDGDIDGTGGYSKYAILKPSRAFAVGDVIAIKAYATSDAHGNDFGLCFYASNEASATALETCYLTVTKNTEETLSYTVTEGDGIAGLPEVYVFRAVGKSTFIDEVEITSGSYVVEAVREPMKCETATTITVPDLNDGKQDWIYVSATAAPTVVNGVTTLEPVADATDGPDANGSNMVYKYKVANMGNANLTFAAGTYIYKIGVTHILKEMHEVGSVGWATESRNHAIDHALTGYFTVNDVNAYIVGYDSYDMNTATVALTPVKENGYVTKETGIVLKLDHADKLGKANNQKNVPLFYPSYTMPASSTATIFKATGNLMKANLEKTKHDSETEDEYTKFILTNIHWTFKEGEDLLTDEEAAYQEADAAGFYRLHIWETTGDKDEKNTMAANTAYLCVPTDNLPTAVWNMTSAPARKNTIGIRGAGGVETGIVNLLGEGSFEGDDGAQADAVWYTLSGMRLSGPPAKAGLYIRNGRKVAVRQ